MDEAGAEDHDRYNHDCRQDAADRFIIPSRDSESFGGGLSMVRFPEGNRKTSTDTLAGLARVGCGFGGFDEAPILFESNHTRAVQSYGIRSRPSSASVTSAPGPSGVNRPSSRATATGITVSPVSPARPLAGSVAKPASGQVSRRTSAPYWSGKPSQPLSSPSAPKPSCCLIGRVTRAGKRNSLGGIDFVTRSFLTATATPPGEIRE
jgi:hypothetical protein